MALSVPAREDDDNETSEPRLAVTTETGHQDDPELRAPSTVLVVEGEIDVATGTKLRAALAASLAEANVDVVVADLRAVTFMSSTGIAVLVDANAEAKHVGKSLRLLTAGNRAVLGPLRTTGVDALLNLDPVD